MLFSKRDEEAGDLNVDMTKPLLKPYSEGQIERAKKRAECLIEVKTTEWERRLNSHKYFKQIYERIKDWVDPANLRAYVSYFHNSKGSSSH